MGAAGAKAKIWLVNHRPRADHDSPAVNLSTRFLDDLESVLDTSRILAPSARSRYEDDRYGAPGTATLNRTVPSSWDPQALGAECRVLAPPPQGDVFSCTKPQWLAQSILTIDHPSSFYRGNNELRTWSRRATLNRGRAFFFSPTNARARSRAVSSSGELDPPLASSFVTAVSPLKVIGKILDRLN